MAADSNYVFSSDRPAPKPFRFLDLPTEMRLQVYRVAIGNERVSLDIAEPFGQLQLPVLIKTSSSLIKTSRKLREEVLPLHYNRVTIRICICKTPINSGCIRRAFHWASVLRDDTAAAITKLRIDLALRGEIMVNASCRINLRAEEEPEILSVGDGKDCSTETELLFRRRIRTHFSRLCARFCDVELGRPILSKNAVLEFLRDFVTLDKQRTPNEIEME